MERKWYEPVQIFSEYKRAQEHKQTLCTRGLFEQNKVNERFYAGDQWHGVQAGENKPLVRLNVIRRIGEYKMSIVGSSAVAVQYSAEGVPNTKGIKKKVRDDMEVMRAHSEQGLPPEEMPQPQDENERINLIMSAMSDYFRVTAERLKFDDLKTKALRKAYLSGTGVLYTYWDERVKTGLYADMEKTSPIAGDICCEVLDIENVCFGDPNMESVQGQPYIIIAQRKSVDELKRAARRNHRPAREIEAIKPDKEYNGYTAGYRAEDEPHDTRKATVLTKFYKKWDEEGESFKIYAVEVVEGATIRRPWDLKVRLYPLAKMVWEERANSAYGDSEVTHIVANQIAINRAITAATWSTMMNGMPIMVVNGDVVTQPITNEPGQVVKVYGDAQDVERAIKYVESPSASSQFEKHVDFLVNNTLTHHGANDAALGNMRPDNTSAILAVRDATAMPLQLLENRFYSFIEDVARIFAEFWVSMYGIRALKIEDKEGEWYLPFNGEDCKELLISARVDVGKTGMYSEIKRMETLDGMYKEKIVDVIQYLERLPDGVVPDLQGLIEEIKDRQAAAAQQVPPKDADPNGTSGSPSPTIEGGGGDPMPDIGRIVQNLPVQYQKQLAAMTPEQQQQVLNALLQGGM